MEGHQYISQNFITVLVVKQTYIIYNNYYMNYVMYTNIRRSSNRVELTRYKYIYFRVFREYILHIFLIKNIHKYIQRRMFNE